jgi:hypothetical protein
MLTMALWKNADGILIANSSGILINCDTCPCEDPAPTTCPCATYPPPSWPCNGLLEIYTISSITEEVGTYRRRLKTPGNLVAYARCGWITEELQFEVSYDSGASWEDGLALSWALLGIGWVLAFEHSFPSSPNPVKATGATPIGFYTATNSGITCTAEIT